MDRETYTIEDVAQMTGLSSRTIRTYRKMGLLEGALQGNTWTFTPEQVGKLLNEPYVQGAIEAKRNAIWTGFLQDTGKQVPSLCTSPPQTPKGQTHCWTGSWSSSQQACG